MQDKYSVSVIIPIYNEQALLKRSVDYIDRFLTENFQDYEILLIESGSTDGSFEICDKIGGYNPKIKVVHEGSRKGFGSALKLGYKNATKDLLWLVTVDLPFPLESIFRALPLFSKYDYVLSFRSEDNRHIYRRLQSFVYNTLVKSVLGLKVKQINSAFKVFKREVIQNTNFICNGWFIDTEICYRLKKQGVSYTEIAVPLVDRLEGEPSVRLLTFVSVLKELVHFLKNKDK